MDEGWRAALELYAIAVVYGLAIYGAIQLPWYCALVLGSGIFVRMILILDRHGSQR